MGFSKCRRSKGPGLRYGTKICTRLTPRLNRLFQQPLCMLIFLVSIATLTIQFPYYQRVWKTSPVTPVKKAFQFQELVTVSRTSNILPVQNHDPGKNVADQKNSEALTSLINLSNISKLANTKLFDVLTDDHIPESNWSSYEHTFTVGSELNFPYLVTGEEICKKDIPFVLIIIPSVITEIDHRDLIRKTWLRAAETNSWPREEVIDEVKHVFFFGLHKNDRDKDFDLLTKESVLNNDIVVADFEDSYRNLSIKMLVSLKWTMKYCDQVQFVLKVDMDTFINVPLMMSLLHHVQNNVTSDQFVIGLKHTSAKPKVVRNTGRWEVSQNEFPLPHYPKYLIGHTYALSMGSIHVLVSAAKNKPIIAPEDAFITGILSKLTGVLRLNAPSFTECCSRTFDCGIVWNKKVALTGMKTNVKLERLWSNIVLRQCNNTHPIK